MWSPRLKNVESKIAFGQLILRKIVNTVATRCQISRLKCTKIQNSAGCWGPYSAPPDPQLDLRGLLLRGGEGVKGTGRGQGGMEGVLWSPK